MRLIVIMLVVGYVLVGTGCGEATGVPTEFANACSPDNEKKYIEVSGVLEQRGSVFCSNIGGGPVTCGFDLLESPGSDKKLRVDIPQGTAANTVDKLTSGYKKEDVKIRDKAGTQIALGSDRVKLTGKMSIAAPVGDSAGVCNMTVEKIEK